MRLPGGDRTRTLYSTRHGPVFTSLLGLPLFPWTPTSAYALGDANAANFRYLNHFFEVNRAQSVRELDGIERRYQGIPWVNTIAADSNGEAYYADIGAVPNVTNAKAAACNTALGTADALAARRADPRRLAVGLRVGQRSRRRRAGHLRARATCRACSATTT